MRLLVNIDLTVYSHCFVNAICDSIQIDRGFRKLMPNMSQHAFGRYCWIDLATTDPEAAQSFYGALMGWEFDNMLNEGELIYSMIQLDGKHVAGMGQLQPPQLEAGMPPTWSSYVCVEDAGEMVKKCEALGAQTLAGSHGCI